MDDKTRDFALKYFSEYYKLTEFEIPSIEKREFGIGSRKKIDSRHLSFESLQQFRNFLTNNTPLFVSYSSSYYSFPVATPIQKKMREGADLIFDLDTHSDSKYGVYSKLDEVKNDIIRLSEDFLVSDFGIDKKYQKIVFSGNRGYHLHVYDKNFFDLGSEERREIVDYVCGVGLNYRNFLNSETVGKRLSKTIGPKPEDGGYPGRFARAVLRILDDNPESISRKFKKSEERERFVSGIKEGNWNKASVPKLIEKLEVAAKALPLLTISADSAVTHDLSKLLRVPNSIHGETGFIAKTVADIDKFDPMRDSLLPSEDIVKIKFTENVPELKIADGYVGPFKADDTKEFSLPIALFFLLKESAVLMG